MAKKNKEPSVYRFMCIKTDCKNYHTDFVTKEEALQYAESLSDSKIEWYGIYEIDPLCDHLKSVTYKRLIPYDDRIPERFLKEKKENTFSSNEKSDKKVRRRRANIK